MFDWSLSRLFGFPNGVSGSKQKGMGRTQDDLGPGLCSRLLRCPHFPSCFKTSLQGAPHKGKINRMMVLPMVLMLLLLLLMMMMMMRRRNKDGG